MATRYPDKGKGHKWTVRELLAIPADWKGDTVNDTGGLFGEIRVNNSAVSIRFRYAFKWQGKSRWYQCGTFPTVSLAEIRKERDKARALLAKGINPNDAKKAERIAAQAEQEKILEQARIEAEQDKTVAEMFADWTQNGVSRKDGNAEIFRSFGRDILPSIGDIPVKNLTDKNIIDCLRVIGQEQEKARTAERLLADVKQMLRWAEMRMPWRRLLVEGNPAALVERHQVLPHNYQGGVRNRVLAPEEIRELAELFNAGVLQKTSQIALWLSLSTMCRIGELLKARWDDVDFSNAEWLVPAENTKTGVPWYVYLSDFALWQFKRLNKLTGHSEWCFPARRGPGHVCVKSVTKQVGDRQIKFKNRKKLKGRRNDNSLVLPNGEWTPHDLRRTGATMMQGLGVPLDIIDRCQNHVLSGSQVRRHYLHHDYKDEKTDAWARLGAEIQNILKP